MTKKERVQAAREAIHRATAEMAQARVKLRDAGADQEATAIEKIRTYAADLRDEIEQKWRLP